MSIPLGKAWNVYWRSMGFVGSGEHLVPDVERHHPIRIIGGGHHGRQTVRRDLQHYRVALVAGEFVMVPDDWVPGTEVVEITKLRINPPRKFHDGGLVAAPAAKRVASVMIDGARVLPQSMRVR